ncbi:MAG: hypothetical protein HY459_03505 [Parcubacteria group bacterium]|nr:hypothetical protein [Parcubacteria group bacterium]
MPEGTQWENLALHFVDGNNVKIYVSGKFLKEVNLNEMGLLNRKTKPRRRSKPGDLLYLFATLHGELGWDEPTASSKYIKHKQLLCDALKEFFVGTPGDPIEWIKRDGVYRSRVLLVIGDVEPKIQTDNAAIPDLQDSYKELTAGSYDA